MLRAAAELYLRDAPAPDRRRARARPPRSRSFDELYERAARSRRSTRRSPSGWSSWPAAARGGRLRRARSPAGRRAVGRAWRSRGPAGEGDPTRVVAGLPSSSRPSALVGVDPIADGLQVVDAARAGRRPLRRRRAARPVRRARRACSTRAWPSLLTQVDSPRLAAELKLALLERLPRARGRADPAAPAWPRARRADSRCRARPGGDRPSDLALPPPLAAAGRPRPRSNAALHDDAAAGRGRLPVGPRADSTPRCGRTDRGGLRGGRGGRPRARERRLVGADRELGDLMMNLLLHGADRVPRPSVLARGRPAGDQRRAGAPPPARLRRRASSSTAERVMRTGTGSRRPRRPTAPRRAAARGGAGQPAGAGARRRRCGAGPGRTGDRLAERRRAPGRRLEEELAELRRAGTGGSAARRSATCWMVDDAGELASGSTPRSRCARRRQSRAPLPGWSGSAGAGDDFATSASAADSSSGGGQGCRSRPDVSVSDGQQHNLASCCRPASARSPLAGT